MLNDGWQKERKTVTPSGHHGIKSERYEIIPRILLVLLQPQRGLLQIHIIPDCVGLLLCHFRNRTGRIWWRGWTLRWPAIRLQLRGGHSIGAIVGDEIMVEKLRCRHPGIIIGRVIEGYVITRVSRWWRDHPCRLWRVLRDAAVSPAAWQVPHRSSYLTPPQKFHSPSALSTPEAHRSYNFLETLTTNAHNKRRFTRPVPLPLPLPISISISLLSIFLFLNRCGQLPSYYLSLSDLFTLFPPLCTSSPLPSTLPPSFP